VWLALNIDILKCLILARARYSIPTSLMTCSRLIPPNAQYAKP